MDLLPEERRTFFINFSNNYTKKPKKLFADGKHILCHFESLISTARTALAICIPYFYKDVGHFLLAQQSAINILTNLSYIKPKYADYRIALTKNFVENLVRGVTPAKSFELAITFANAGTEIFRHPDYVPEWKIKQNKNSNYKQYNKNNNKGKNFNHNKNFNNNYNNNNKNNNRKNNNNNNNNDSNTEPKTRHLDHNQFKPKKTHVEVHMCNTTRCTAPGCSNRYS